MQIRRWTIGWLLVSLPLCLWAVQKPVLVENTSKVNVDYLRSCGFRLHARLGEQWLGMLPEGSRLPAGVVRLGLESGNLENLYQIDRRALEKKSELIASLPIVYQTESWILLRGETEALKSLCSAGIAFRAISAEPYIQREGDDCLPGLDNMNPFVGVILEEVSMQSYQDYLQTLQDFVTRNTYNPECNSAAQWISQTFADLGLTVVVDTFQIGMYTRYNVIAQKTGTLHPDQIYYLTAHYDATAGLPIFPEDEAPGADDDGSGAALVLECARVMSQFDFENTIRFALFAGNEQGLIGSEAYVTGLPQTGEVYLGVFNADMVGWSGLDTWPPDLVIYSNNNPSSGILATKIMEANGLYTSNFLQPISLADPTMVYSDHAPFWDAGIPAVVLMEDEAWGDDLNPYYHSVDDLLQYLDVPYAVQVLKVILASAADLSLPVGSTTPVLTAANPVIDDSPGNNNGQIDYGESVYLTIPVINAGGAPAPSVEVLLFTTDPYLTFTDWQQNYGSIPALDTTAIMNAFAASVSDTVPDEHFLYVTVNMTSGASTWQSQVQMVAHAPAITILGVVVDDTITGNGNGQLELGETADLEITLQNQGSCAAPSLTAALGTTSPYIIIQTPSSAYGTLTPGASNTRAYRVQALANAPPYFAADFSLIYSATGGWTDGGGFPLDVGDLTHMPTGPDTYGYMAYDINDEPFGPVYDWVEIDPAAGGAGTPLDFTEDDQTLFVNFPFTFVYYGLEYAEISVCTNGWIACGHRNNNDYSNSPIPNWDGPLAMIAPFWDDLSPQAEGTVCVYYDTTGGRFIVEYNNVRDFQPNWAHDTFEIILYDPIMHPTNTGDGKILVQYGDLDEATSCTVGIENHTTLVGLQYLYNTVYAPTSTPIGAGMAILYTTGEALPDVQVTLTPTVLPIQIPASGGNFDFNIAVTNNEAISTNFQVWCDVTLPSGTYYGPVIGPVTATLGGGLTVDRDRTQTVPAAAPAGSYFYNAHVGEYPAVSWSSDSFSFSKLPGSDGVSTEQMSDWASWGEPFDFSGPISAEGQLLAQQFSLGQNYPNPFNPLTRLEYVLPQAGQVKLTILDLQGRTVEVLADGYREAGWHQVTWEAAHYATGIYFCRLQAGNFQAVRKLVLMK